jgi:integrase
MASIKKRIPAKNEKRNGEPIRVRWIDPDGKERGKEFRGGMKKAEAFGRQIEASKENNTYIDPGAGRIRLRDFFDDWSKRAAEIGYPAPSTRAKYAGVFKVHVDPVIGGYQLAKIRPRDVEDMVAVAARRTASQAVEAGKLVRMLLNRAVDAELIGRNPASRVKVPRVEPGPRRVLTPGEIDALVAALPSRYCAAVVLDAYASLRWSELVALKRDDLDLDARTVRIDEALVEVGGEWHWGQPKTQKAARTIHLPELVIPVLAQHLLSFPPLLHQEDPRREGLVFSGERGGPVRRHSFRKAFKRACTQAGIEGMRPGWLRHTGAAIAYAATKDLKAVSERLGHTSTRMADTTYVHVYDETAKAVAAAIDDMVRASTG